MLLMNDHNENEKYQWCLEAVADIGREWPVCIDSVPFVIGRAKDSNFRLLDKRISRYHCELRISSGLLWIRDLGSTNGTFINNKKIDHAEMIEAGDIVTIGKYEFKAKRIDAPNPHTKQDTVFSTINEEICNLSGVEDKMRSLIHERNVIPHFQPIVRFSDMREVGYEILGRIDDVDLPSNPSELLDMAESLGCVLELSSIFREVGVEIGKNLPGLPVLFVNTNRLEIYDMKGLIASLERIRDIAPSNKIVLELDEKAASDANTLSELSHALEMMNMALAFDDFGVGQTRLVELSNLSPDYLKFDISLIRQIHIAPKRLHQMIETFIRASHDLGILALAEGIECEEEFEVCRQLGFDLGQGFYFGRPESIDTIECRHDYTARYFSNSKTKLRKKESKCSVPPDESIMSSMDVNRTFLLNDENEIESAST